MAPIKPVVIDRQAASPRAGAFNGWAIRAAVAVLAMLAIGISVVKLEAAKSGVFIATQWLDGTPVTVFRPATPLAATTAAAAAPATARSAAPVVLIAHGFAGSQQLMQPFALTLARNGFVAITFDFPGHGRNSAPMRGGLADQDESLRTLLASMANMGDFASALSQLAGGDRRYAVLGHSMASDIVVRHAQAHDDVQASVGVSLFAPSITALTAADSPRNLLVIAGAAEPQVMEDEALRVVGRGAGRAGAGSGAGSGAGPGSGTGAGTDTGTGLASSATVAVKLDVTYGQFADGTARRATLSPGVEHIGVLYSRHTLAETLNWLNAAFERPAAPVNAFIDARGPWLGLLLLGVVALAWPLSLSLSPLLRLLPSAAATVAVTPIRLRWWRWRGQAPVTLLPALLTPLLLWPLPSAFLPILLGDYLVLHFGLYGLLTLAGLRLTGRWPQRVQWPFAGRQAIWVLALAVVATSAYALLAVGVPIDRYVFNMSPPADRLPLILAVLAGTLPYFLADGWLTQDAHAARFAAWVSKLCFLLSLVVAIALNPSRLFFLAIIVPAILLLFLIYGLFSRWVGKATGHPAVAAVANALAFAWFIAVTFPRVE